MSSVINIENNQGLAIQQDGTGIRTAVMVYSLLSYAVGMAGLCWLILAMGGILPYGFGPIQTGSTFTAILLDAFLIAMFGIQHSVMARKSFKRKLTRLIPAPAERSTFVLASGVVMALIVWLWQPLPGSVWSVENTYFKVLLWILYAAGWGYLVAATFVTNHFELFGLRQAYLYFRGIPYTPVSFVKKWMYTYSRHPMMLGVLVGLWSVPDMSVSHFILALFMSIYIYVGVLFEEEDLVRDFGDTYQQYRKEIGSFFTFK